MKIINKTNIIAGLFTITLATTSCNSIKNANNQQKGTAIGTTTGGVIGGIIGNQIGGNTPIGIVLGAVIGGAAGNLIGHKMDKQAKEIQQTLPGAEVKRVGEGIKVTLGENVVNFAFNSSDLSDTAKTNLDKLATVLTQNPKTNISIYGYTDSVGTDDYNLKLSQKRAEAVKAYLATDGIDPNRLTAIGNGKADPIASNDTDAGRAQNRRVEFAITANQDMVKEAEKTTGTTSNSNGNSNNNSNGN